MGVEEVYNFLKKHKGYHSVKEISKGVKVSHRAVKKSINIISRYEDIVSKYAHLMRDKARKGVGIKTRKAWLYAHVNRIKKRRCNCLYDFSYFPLWN